MSVIQLKEKNCRHCHHCVRVCPTKAISFCDQDPMIIKEDCILCGQCYVVCPHNAKTIQSDYPMVQQWIKDGFQVHVSLAPSYVGLLQNKQHLKDHLLTLGFSSVQETALAAARVTDIYRQLCEKNQMENIITTCCPVVVSLIQTRFKELVPQLAPVMSPMRAHGKMLKTQNPNDKVVFLGPCIAKIEEARICDEIDGVITFEDVFKDMIPMDGNFNFDDGFVNDRARIYPATGGILATMIGGEHFYHTMHVDGIDQVIDCCHAIMDHQIENVFIEMSACVGSCLGGPLLQEHPLRKWKARQILTQKTDQRSWVETDPALSLHCRYHATTHFKKSFDDKAIENVLERLGKHTKEDHLDCGACGYPTCIEKAIGVLEGKADPTLCLPYALEKARSMSNLIIQHTPNGILVIDQNMQIVEANPAAKRYLKINNGQSKHPITHILRDDSLTRYLCDLQEVTYFIKEYPHLDRTFDHACIPIKNQHVSVIILMDLTEKLYKEKQLKEYRTHIMQVTQRVIDEQMQTVQEIASLLGETSAKSKIALVQLKKSLEDDLI